MYHKKVITYISRKLKPIKINYPIYGIELVIMVIALKIWRHYLYIQREMLDIYGLQKLKILNNLERLNLRQVQWLELLKDYAFSINYHLGKANIIADAFSRKFQGILARVLVTFIFIVRLKAF